MCGLSGEFLIRILLLNIVYLENNFVKCAELTDNFNDNIRDYSVKENDLNSTKVRTLQKEEVGRYASFAPLRNPIRFKEIPDNALSSSSYSRGLLLHEHGGHGGHGGHEGYAIHDGYYEDGSPYGHGYAYGHDYDHHDDHHGHGHHTDHHGHGHHDDHHGHGHGHFGHLGHSHHHKHHDHYHLASKALLWPIAGIALLGAAAALVTNPVLLQLGVVSGRRRRDTSEVSGEFSKDDWPLDPYKRGEKESAKSPNVKPGKKVSQSGQSAGQVAKYGKVKRFIPIPLKLNKRH